MPDLERSDRDALRVEIAVGGPVDAREVANVLTSLDRAFSRFAREEVELAGVRLQIVRTGVGSWWALLIATKEFVDLTQDHPDLIPVFVNNVDVTYRTLTDQAPAQTQKHMRDLVRDLARAGKRLGAASVDLISLTRVAIAAEHYDLVSRPDVETRADAAPKRVATKKQRLSMLTYDAAIEEAGQLAGTGSLFGTIFLVDGSWYARAEGFGGVLLPLTLDTLARLTVQDGVAYGIEGDLLRSPEGYPSGIAVRNLTHIQGAP